MPRSHDHPFRIASSVAWLGYILKEIKQTKTNGQHTFLLESVLNADKRFVCNTICTHLWKERSFCKPIGELGDVSCILVLYNICKLFVLWRKIKLHWTLLKKCRYEYHAKNVVSDSPTTSHANLAWKRTNWDRIVSDQTPAQNRSDRRINSYCKTDFKLLVLFWFHRMKINTKNIGLHVMNIIDI